MTKARDLSSLIGSSGQIDNAKITLDANEIPALDTAKITTGTFADARISASSVSQHATSFDDNKIVNDISTLALRQASDANRSAYNTNSQFVDVFQDSTGIDTTTNCGRDTNEFIASVIPSHFTVDTNGTLQTNLNNLHNFDNNPDDAVGSMVLTPINTPTYSSSTKKLGTHSVYLNDDSDGFSLNWNSTGAANFGANESVSMSCWINHDQDSGSWNMLYDGITSASTDGFIFAARTSGFDYPAIYATSDGWAYANTDISINTWHHLVFCITTSVKQIYLNGSLILNNSGSRTWNAATSDHRLFRRYNTGVGLAFKGYCDQMAFWKKQLSAQEVADLYNSGSGNVYVANSASATGNFTGTTITAPSSVSSMGAIITYQDNAGTNALNTDIVLQLSADGGSNWSTATLSALPNFATGIKMAKVNDLAVTAGTNLKYKLSFANQALGSKEARIRGVALQY